MRYYIIISMRRIRLYINILLLSLMMFGSVAFLPVSVLADNDSAVDEINVTVPISCTLGGTGMDTHNATINNGQYNSAIGETTMKAFCNDSNGFAIYAIGYTDDTDGNNVLINATLGDTYDIATGTLITGANSQWAMKLSTITSPVPTYPIIIAGSTADTDKEQGDPDFTSFQEVPDDYTKVAYRKAGTDINPTGQSTAEGATLKSTYQVYISQTQPAGTYTGQVKYTMVHPYNAAKPGPKSIATATTMQEVDSCPADLPEEQIYTLTDTRDNQDYKVAKLKDGKCWMVENLNITGGTALSSEDTDFTDDYDLPSTAGWVVSDGKLVLPMSSIYSFGMDNWAGVYNTNNKTDCGASGQTAECYSYYTWDAATLGSGRDITTGDIDAPYSICPKGWRLPTARIRSEPRDYYDLALAYGVNLVDEYYNQDSTDFYDNLGPGTIPGFLLAGSRSSANNYSAGIIGVYWSSTSYYDLYAPSGARELYIMADSIYVANGGNRGYGNAVRCIVR